MMREYFEKGFKVVVEGFYGDYEMDEDMMTCYEDDGPLDEQFDFERVEGQTAYFSEKMDEGWDE